jgi:hypothetical protein
MVAGGRTSIRHDLPINVGNIAVWADDGRIEDGGPVLSGGDFTIDPYTTGLTHTVTLTASQAFTITKATSATPGAKTVNIPGAGTAGRVWILKTTLADGTAYTITPAFGTVDGASTYVFSDNARDATWLIDDGASNWMIV